MAGETELQMCIRHVAEQETRIVRQEALIERLRKVGAPLDGALGLLITMHALLETMHAHLARLKVAPASRTGHEEVIRAP
jgi:hypothetical protein